MIFAQKSLPRPKTSRTVSTISSACSSFLAKISVLGTMRLSAGISSALREDLGEEAVTECLDDGLHLAPAHDADADVARTVSEVVVEILVSLLTGPAIPDWDGGACLYERTGLGNVCLDPVYVKVNVYAVGDSLLVGVLAD